MMAAPESVIEIGSTGVRLLVAELTADRKQNVLDRSDMPLPLGKDVFTSGQVGQETIGKEDLADDSQMVRKKRDLRAECLSGGIYGSLPHDAGDTGEGTAQEISEAHTECSQCKTGYVLIGFQGYRQDAVDQGTDQGEQQTSDHGTHNAQKADRGICAVFIQKSACKTADGTHVHDAGDTHIQVAAFFCKDLSGSTVKERHTLGNGSLDKGDRKDIFKDCP